MNRVTNVQADMTDYKTHETNKHFQTLGEKVKELSSEGMKNKYQFIITDMWGAIYKKGDWTKPHQHWPYTWSFTYYVKASEKTSPIVFSNVVHPHNKEIKKMPIQPKTQREHIISLHGHITGVKKDLNNVKENHLKHMKQDIENLGGKIDKIYGVVLTTVGAVGLVIIEALLNRLGM